MDQPLPRIVSRRAAAELVELGLPCDVYLVPLYHASLSAEGFSTSTLSPETVSATTCLAGSPASSVASSDKSDAKERASATPAAMSDLMPTSSSSNSSSAVETSEEYEARRDAALRMAQVFVFRDTQISAMRRKLWSETSATAAVGAHLYTLRSRSLFFRNRYKALVDSERSSSTPFFNSQVRLHAVTTPEFVN